MNTAGLLLFMVSFFVVPQLIGAVLAVISRHTRAGRVSALLLPSALCVAFALLAYGVPGGACGCAGEQHGAAATLATGMMAFGAFLNLLAAYPVQKSTILGYQRRRIARVTRL